jgi:hypothetical protein
MNDAGPRVDSTMRWHVRFTSDSGRIGAQQRTDGMCPEGHITRWRVNLSESFAIELATADHEVAAAAPPSPARKEASKQLSRSQL